MRVAAVIPLFNKRRDIGAALDSVLKQTCPVDEIVVVDDASTDGGNLVAAGYADSRIRLLQRSAPGPGGYAARNLAIRSSASQWVAFLDADDVWRPDHIETLSTLMAAWPTAGCVASRFTHVFHDRREPQRVGPSLNFPDDASVTLDFVEFLEAWLAVRDCPLWTGALAIRRDVFERSGLFPEHGVMRGGDKDLWLRVARATTVAFSPKLTADFYRESENKLTDRVDTRRLPCLVETARSLTRVSEGREPQLLRRLINQEIELYARWSAKHGGRPPIKIADLTWPVAPATLATLLAARYTPRRWLRAAHQLEHRRRAWSRRQ